MYLKTSMGMGKLATLGGWQLIILSGGFRRGIHLFTTPKLWAASACFYPKT